MTPIPNKLRKELALDPEYKICAKAGFPGHTCDGRITLEHAVIYAGRQIQERWAIIPLCAKAHSVDWHQNDGDLDKEVNLWIALNRATDAELLTYSKVIPYLSYRERLNAKFGTWKSPYQHIPRGITTGDKPVGKLLKSV